MTQGLPSAGLRALPAGAAPGSILETSREDALNEPSEGNIVHAWDSGQEAESPLFPLSLSGLTRQSMRWFGSSRLT